MISINERSIQPAILTLTKMSAKRLSKKRIAQTVASFFSKAKIEACNFEDYAEDLSSQTNFGVHFDFVSDGGFDVYLDIRIDDVNYPIEYTCGYGGEWQLNGNEGIFQLLTNVSELINTLGDASVLRYVYAEVQALTHDVLEDINKTRRIDVRKRLNDQIKGSKKSFQFEPGENRFGLVAWEENENYFVALLQEGEIGWYREISCDEWRKMLNIDSSNENPAQRMYQIATAN